MKTMKHKENLFSTAIKVLSRIPLRLLMSLMIVLAACSDGADGVDGIDGIDGINGINGTDGEDGLPGEDGTSTNVIYSEWIASPIATPIPLSGAIGVIGSQPALTQDIVDSGTVLCYGGISSNGEIYKLPVTFNNNDNKEVHFFAVLTNQLRIGILSLDELTPIGERLFDQYRYIIIPEGTPASKNSVIDYKKMSYDEIMDHFGIPK